MRDGLHHSALSGIPVAGLRKVRLPRAVARIALAGNAAGDRGGLDFDPAPVLAGNLLPDRGR